MRALRKSFGFAAGALALAVLAFFLAAGSCAPSPEAEDSEPEFDLNNPIIAQPAEQPTELPLGEDVIGMNPENMWKARCGLCHDRERGLDRFKGEEWQPIIERMMKKPGALMNAGIAGMIYVYLYERTTGELHPDRDELLNPPVNTSGSQQFVGGQN